MKQLCTALLLSVCTSTAVAQTLTDANSIPAVGHTETRTYYNSPSADGWNLTGTGNTWDATGVDALRHHGRRCATTAHRAIVRPRCCYPGTTLCAQRVQDGNTEWRH